MAQPPTAALMKPAGSEASSTGPATHVLLRHGYAHKWLESYLRVRGRSVPRPDRPRTAWQNEPPLANARRNAATVAVGSNLYAITGFNLPRLQHCKRALQRHHMDGPGSYPCATRAK